MVIIWKHQRGFMKDIFNKYPHSKPAITTIATLFKRMQEKGYIADNTIGNSREYYPLVNKENFFSSHVNGLIKNYYDNSLFQFASFFTTATNLIILELKDLKTIVDKEIKRKQK
ncbi:BlaI/MecI/CopY family transcriptional regulator [Cyclobacterium plantarum]|uniref:BlaI/MecI/CopY family transcriptional regulator n=1 Tax=Cyclobacterium plantarum TaxID=2716263 RepID=UPI003F70B755